MTRRSAGVLLWRRGPDAVQVLLGHMGGPWFARKDAGAWSIPKGEVDSDEEPIAAARREFLEELGVPAPPGPWLALGAVRQAGGKEVTAWAVEGDLDPDCVRPGTFEMEWPPRSGRRQAFPEVDRVAWFALADARGRIVKAQALLLDRLETLLGSPGVDAL